MRQRKGALTSAIGLAVVAIALAGQSSCRDDQPIGVRNEPAISETRDLAAVAPRRSATLTAEAATARVATARIENLTAEQRQRIDNARAAVRWVGEMHRAAVREFLDSPVLKLPRGPERTAQLCRLAEKLTLKYVALTDSRVGQTRSAAAQQQFALAAVRENGNCGASRTLSVFGTSVAKLPELSISSPATTFAHYVLEDSVLFDGSSETYANIMMADIEATDGSVSAVTSAVNNVLAAAASIPDGDMIVLAEIAEIALSAAVDYNNFDWEDSGARPDQCDDLQYIVPPGYEEEFEEECDSQAPMMLSVFSPSGANQGWKTFFKRTGQTIAADAIGCGTAVWVSLVNAGWTWWAAAVAIPEAAIYLLTAECVGWGAGTSLAYLVSLL